MNFRMADYSYLADGIKYLTNTVLLVITNFIEHTSKFL